MSKRLGKELQTFGKGDLAWVKAELVDDSSIFKWRVEFAGPEKSVYEKGLFKVLIDIPTEYPFKPPKFSFETKIFHPNVKSSDGTICTDILGDGWSPQLKIADCLITLRTLMAEPNPDNPLEADVAEQYVKDRAGFEKTAKEWVKKFASK